MTLGDLLDSAARPELGAHLDGLSPNQRVDECLALSAQQQKRLWQVVSAEPGETQQLAGDGETARFAGRNSLRMFTRFDKCFVRQRGELVGYNRHRLAWLIGPGYFTVSSTPKTLVFDYGRVPASAPEGWPPVAPNTGGFAKAVYGNLYDDVVWVATDVLIGSARRGETPLDSYFVLVRT